MYPKDDLTSLLREKDEISKEFGKLRRTYKGQKPLWEAIDEGLCNPDIHWRIKNKKYNNHVYKACLDYLIKTREILNKIEERMAKYKKGEVDYL